MVGFTFEKGINKLDRQLKLLLNTVVKQVHSTVTKIRCVKESFEALREITCIKSEGQVVSFRRKI